MKTAKLSMIVLVLCLSLCLIHVPCARASSTLGYSGVGGSAVSTATIGFKTLQTMPEDGTLTKMYLYCHEHAGCGSDLCVGLYLADVLQFHVDKTIAEAVDAWVEFDIPDTFVASGVVVGFGFKMMGGYSTKSTQYYRAGAADQVERDNSMAVTDHLADPFDDNQHMTSEFSIYADYTAGSGTPANKTFILSNSICATSTEASKKDMSFSEHAVIPFAYLEQSSRAIVILESALIPFQFLESSQKTILFNPSSSIDFSLAMAGFVPFEESVEGFFATHRNLCIALMGLGLVVFTIILAEKKNHDSKA